MLEVRYDAEDKKYIVFDHVFCRSVLGKDVTLLRAAESLGQQIWQLTENLLRQWAFLKHEYRLCDLPKIERQLMYYFPQSPTGSVPEAHFHFLYKYLPDDHFIVDCWNDITDFIMPALRQPSMLLSVELTSHQCGTTSSLLLLPQKSCRLEIKDSNQYTYIHAYGANLKKLDPLRNNIIDSVVGEVLNKTGRMLFER